MNPNILTSKKDPTKQVNVNDLLSAVDQGNIIILIKNWRTMSGDGLKDSKDKIESLIVFDPKLPKTGSYSSSGRGWDAQLTKNSIMSAFIELSQFPQLTKEEFVNMVSNAVDQMHTFHCTDMIEAVEFLFKNIKAKGGLQKIAEENHNFLDGI